MFPQAAAKAEPKKQAKQDEKGKTKLGLENSKKEDFSAWSSFYKFRYDVNAQFNK